MKTKANTRVQVVLWFGLTFLCNILCMMSSERVVFNPPWIFCFKHSNPLQMYFSDNSIKDKMIIIIIMLCIQVQDLTIYLFVVVYCLNWILFLYFVIAIDNVGNMKCGNFPIICTNTIHAVAGLEKIEPMFKQQFYAWVNHNAEVVVSQPKICMSE